MDRTVTFPGTDITTPRVFAGSWRVEEQYFGKVDKEEIVGAFARSFSQGLPLNTAIEYGNGSGEPGRAERWGAEAVRAAGVEDPIVVTKYGVHMPLLHGSRSTPGCHPDSILEDFGSSRERLGFEPAGWVLHHYDQKTPVEEVLEAVNRLYDDGRIKLAGISHGFERLKGRDWRQDYDYWRQNGPFQLIEQNYNMLSGSSPLDHPQIAYALEHGLVATIYSVLGTGLASPRVLDGEMSPEDAKYGGFFEEDGTPKPNVAAARKVRDALMPRFESLGLEWVSGLVSLAASLHPQIVPIIGVRTEKHVDDLVFVLDHLLSSDQVGEIGEALSREGLLPGLAEFLHKTAGDRQPLY